MKKQILILSFLIFSSALLAQVDEAGCMISLGKHSSFIVDHEGASQKVVSKIWENTFKEYGKVKRNKKAKEWACNECLIPLVSASPINVYFKIDEGKNRATSYTLFDDGEKFIDSDNDPKSAKVIKEIIQGMAYDVEREVIKEELKEEENNLKKFEKELSKLADKNEDLHSDIENYKEKIIKAEKEIEKNFDQQGDKKMEIEKQGRLVQKVIEKLNNVGRKSF